MSAAVAFQANIKATGFWGAVCKQALFFYALQGLFDTPTFRV